MNTKTAMGELIETLEHNLYNNEQMDIVDVLNIARPLLEKEKQMVIDAFRDGINNVHSGSHYTTPLTYYNQTFKT